MRFCLQQRAKVPPQTTSIRLQTSEDKIIHRQRSLSNHVSRRSCNLSSCFMEIKCQNWITGFHQSLSSDLALGLLTFMQSWRQTVFGDWCKIAPGAGTAANQRRCKITGILMRSCRVVPRWGWMGGGWERTEWERTAGDAGVTKKKNIWRNLKNGRTALACGFCFLAVVFVFFFQE